MGRVESFIEHQDACHASRARADGQGSQTVCHSRTASSPSPSGDTKFTGAAWKSLRIPLSPAIFSLHHDQSKHPTSEYIHKRRSQGPELQLLPSIPSNGVFCVSPSAPSPDSDDTHDTQLQLSIGSCTGAADEKSIAAASAASIDEPAIAHDQFRIAMVERAMADEARQQAVRQIELAEQEFANAKRIRQQAQAELNKAHLLRDHAIKQINSTLLHITCQSCKQHFRAKVAATPEDHSIPVSYKSSILADGEGGNNNNRNQLGNISANA